MNTMCSISVPNNWHAETLFYVQPVRLHFWMDSIMVVCIEGHLDNTGQQQNLNGDCNKCS